MLNCIHHLKLLYPQYERRCTLHYKREYHTQSKIKQEKLEQELRRKKAFMTDAEKQMEAEETKKDLARLKKRIHEKIKHTKRIINHRKMATFLYLMKNAEWLAKYLEMNIEIQTTDNLYGILTLQTDYLMLNMDADPRTRKIFNELTLQAEQYSICVKGDVFEMYTVNHEYWPIF